LYIILTEFGVPMKVVRLIQVSLKEVCLDNHLYNNFPMKNAVKQGNVLLPLHLNFAVAIKEVKEGQILCW
jgi:hypothetical protein